MLLALADQLGTFAPLVGGAEHIHCLLVSDRFDIRHTDYGYIIVVFTFNPCILFTD